MNAFSLPILIGIFAVAAIVIVGCGIRMTGVADRIADTTGLGEALVGGLILGAATSLSGTVVSVTAALDGRASLAFSNGIGGIAAQTAFLAFADLIYRRANLEHAAAELANVFQCALLMFLLTIPVLAYCGPDIAFLGIHPASYVLVIGYFAGAIATKRVRETPMWTPVGTDDTEEDMPDEDESDAQGNVRLFSVFAALMIAMGFAG